jgi:hypothetical protein
MDWIVVTYLRVLAAWGDAWDAGCMLVDRVGVRRRWENFVTTEMLAEEIQPGDIVLIRDHGFSRWCGPVQARAEIEHPGGWIGGWHVHLGLVGGDVLVFERGVKVRVR